MRTALLGFLLLLSLALPASAQTPRERAMRVLDVVDELKLDDAMMNKLMPVYTAYEVERDQLLDKQVDLLEQIRLNAEVGADAVADKLLDQHLGVQRALVAAETKLVGKLRRLLPADKARRARVMLLGPAGSITTAASRRVHRETDLFPPGSALESTPSSDPVSAPTKGGCDPFSSMHGCPLPF